MSSCIRSANIGEPVREEPLIVPAPLTEPAPVERPAHEREPQQVPAPAEPVKEPEKVPA